MARHENRGIKLLVDMREKSHEFKNISLKTTHLGLAPAFISFWFYYRRKRVEYEYLCRCSEIIW